MGTNLFVEGTPSPIVVAVTLPRNVHSFRDLRQISVALAEIDNFLRREWSRIWPKFHHRRMRDVWVLSFRADSPPVFQILTDPAWLAVFLIALTGYRQGKESVAEMLADAERLVSRIKGLTEREPGLLQISIRLTLGQMLKGTEEASLEIAKKLRNTRKRLLGEDQAEARPDIVVKDIENKYGPW